MAASSFWGALHQMANSDNISTKRRQGPKRSEASRQAIIDAARQELVEAGWRKFSVDNVARRAKASKQTIYRWWGSASTLCVECGVTLIPDVDQTARDPEERIAVLLQPLEVASRLEFGKEILRGALLAAGDDDAAGELWRSWLNEHVRSPLRMILAEFGAKKVISRDLDVDAAMEFLLGPFWYKLLVTYSMIPEGFSAAQARRLLKAWAA